MRRLATALALLGGCAACASPGGGTSPAPTPDGAASSDSVTFLDAAPPDVPPDIPAVPPPRPVGLTHHGLDGNRYAEGQGAMSAGVSPTTVSVPGTLTWAAGVLGGDGHPVWMLVDADGLATLIRQDGGSLTAEAFSANLAPGQPPAFEIASDGSVNLWSKALDSGLTHPVDVTGSGSLVFVDRDGLVSGPGMPDDVPALPDARILAAGDEVLFLGDPTSRYSHAVLGDGLEAEAIVWVADGVARKALIPAPQVIESIAPLWVDLDGDGSREVIVTVSDSGAGARLRVYGADGEQLAEGPPVGQGFRWRHQLAVAPFGPDGALEIAVVKTPHIGGVAEFYRYTTGSADLALVGERPGYTSHTINSRNLDNGLAADVDGDGVVELLVPNFNLDALCALSRPDADSVAEDFCVPTPAKQRANMAAVTDGAGRLWVGVPYEGGFAVY